MNSTVPTPAPPARSAQTASTGQRARVMAWLKEAALLIGVSGAVLFGVAALKGKGGSSAVAVADRAPAFQVVRADGSGGISSDDLRGKPVVLTFWATWCPACREELPELAALERRAGDSIAVIPVSRENAATVMAYAERKGIVMPLYVGGSAFQAYGIESIPTTMVIDRKGKIIAELTGGVDADKLEELVRRGAGDDGGATIE